MSFSYEEPENDQYFAGLVEFLKSKNEKELIDLISDGSCVISVSSNYSRQRWNAMATEVYFYVSPAKLGKVTDEQREKLRSYCDIVMPKELGFDVVSVEFSPLLGTAKQKKSLIEEAEKLHKATTESVLNIEMPDDLLEKGRTMSEIYHYLYLVENSLRLFIDKISTTTHGKDYWEKLSIPRSVSDGIEIRKKQEKKNLYIRLRGDSELYYCDFKELGDIIRNNWELFKHHFPSQAWIDTKIDEIGNCRNLIAHNSFLEEDEIDLIRVNYKSILKQIGVVVS